jgi:2-polyprenyl-6-methoxyphenol hydroxylase-like FAD-dependent oxidoreductase
MYWDYKNNQNHGVNYLLNIAIVGCGIAGPAAALFLKKLNAQVTVFDKVDKLRPVGAGFLLQPAGLDVLNTLQIAPTLIQRGAPILGLHGTNDKSKVVLDLRYQDLVEHHIGLGMHRAVLYEELYNAMIALDISIVNPCNITQIDNSPERVILKDSEGKSHGPYDCVVIADGAQSRLRHYLNSKIKIKPYEWGALWAICNDKEKTFEKVLEQVYQSTQVMAGVLPIGYQKGESLVSFFWSMQKSHVTKWRNMPFMAWKQEVLNVWPKLTPLLAQLKSHDDLSFASYSDVRMYPWHENRVVVIGDAAHCMSPQLGQGANLGLIDAKVLFDCLRQHPVPQALARYSQARKSQLRFYQNANRFVTPWFQSSSPIMGFLRDQFHGLFCQVPFIRHQMLLTLACMKTGYFKSSAAKKNHY